MAQPLTMQQTERERRETNAKRKQQKQILTHNFQLSHNKQEKPTTTNNN